MIFSDILLRWYAQNKRDLPWRNSCNPYYIWLSEIMLQQTRVAQALPYFLNFTKEFPTIFDLANAHEEQILKHWQGLGYYSRARNMHKTAQKIAFEHSGNFPNNYNDLLKLKGIGTYTAAAIASIAFNENVPVLDGNVFRVLSRYFGVTTDISSIAGKKEFTLLAQSVIDGKNPALFNQAIMEFGALQCVPKNPNCDSCVLNSSCYALKQNSVHLLPVKSKKAKVVDRYFNYIIFIDSQKNTLLNKRTEKGIWQNLYEFPVIETEAEIDFEKVNQMVIKIFQDIHIEYIKPYNQNTIIHKLSHQNLYINFYKAHTNNTLSDGIALSELKNFPVPIVIHNFIEKYLY